MVTEGGQLIDLGSQVATSAGAGASQVMSFKTDSARFDESVGVEVSNVTISFATADEIHLGAIDLGGSTNDLINNPDREDYDSGYTGYGAFWEVYNPTTSSKSESLKIEYPLEQKYPQVFVTAGTYGFDTSGAISGKTLTTESVHPIGVGLAVLDTEASFGKPTIVVGGPCVNVMAAQLMGNPANCEEGFTPGKAVIKLFADKNALLVAGYGAKDTLGASYALVDYKKYGMSGNEVEVVVSSLSDLKVNKIE